MTNGEKFKSAKERHEAYALYCESMRQLDLAILHDEFEWLELEYKVVLRCCPFCGGGAKAHRINYVYTVYCANCSARTVDSVTMNEAIAAWNRRVK